MQPTEISLSRDFARALDPVLLARDCGIQPDAVQAARGLLLRDPAAVENPFFAMVPTGAPTIVLVVLAAAATIIASQNDHPSSAWRMRARLNAPAVGRMSGKMAR